MLFMGSKKYPEENAFSSFISCHGGSTNAMTTDEFTKLGFEILVFDFENYDAVFMS